MKQKKLKIKSNTIFVYKAKKIGTANVGDTTITTTSTGVFI
jgi:hypothetical protein